MNELVIEFLKETTSYLLPITLFMTLAFTLIFLYLGRSSIKKEFKNIKKDVIISLFLIILFGFVLRILSVQYFITFNDELNNLVIAKNIIAFGKAGNCEYTNYGIASCNLYEKFVGFPIILSLFIPFIGSSLNSLIYVNFLFSVLLMPTVFILAYTVFRNEKVSLYSALIVSVFPLFIQHARSLETSVSSALFTSLSILLFFLFYKHRDEKLFLSSIGFSVISVAIRPENICFFGAFLFFYLLTNGINRRKAMSVIYSLILISPALLYVFLIMFPSLFYGQHIVTSPTGVYFEISNIPINIPIIEKVLEGLYYPFVLTIFLFLGIFISFLKSKKNLLILIFPILLLSLLYLMYFNPLERYFFTIFIVMFILMSVGIDFSVNTVIQLASYLYKNLEKIKTISFVLMSIILILLFYPYLSGSIKFDIINFNIQLSENKNFEPRYCGYNDSLAYGYDDLFFLSNELNFFTNCTKDLENCYGITNTLLHLDLADIKPMKINQAIDDVEGVKTILKNNNCVLFFEGMLCKNFSFSINCGLLWPNKSVGCMGGFDFEKCEENKERNLNQCEKMHEVFDLKELRVYKFNVAIHENSSFTRETEVEYKIYNVTLKN